MRSRRSGGVRPARKRSTRRRIGPLLSVRDRAVYVVCWLYGDAAEMITETPLDEVEGRLKPVDPSLFELARVLAR